MPCRKILTREGGTKVFKNLTLKDDHTMEASGVVAADWSALKIRDHGQTFISEIEMTRRHKDKLS